MVLHVRDARAGDGPALAAIYRRASLSNREDCLRLLDHPDALDFNLQLAEHRRTRVAVEEGRRVGFATFAARGETGELEDLFVDPEHFRRGIATALISDLTVIAASLRVRRLEVTANPHALAFYEAVGFVDAGETVTRFGPGHRMRLDLRR